MQKNPHKNKQTNMIQPRYTQFCIISVNTLINIWFKFNYICNTTRWNDVDLITFEIIHVWKFTCTWRVLTETHDDSSKCIWKIKYKITKKNIHFWLLLMFFKLHFKRKKKKV